MKETLECIGLIAALIVGFAGMIGTLIAYFVM